MPAMSLASAVRAAAGQGVKAGAAALDALRPPAPGIVFLIHHRVGGRTTSNVDLPADVFEAQVAELASAGRLVTIDEAVARLASGAAVEGPQPVVLTFDDGTADWADVVLPILVRHGAPATFYVATDFVERSRPFPTDADPVSWGGLAELASSGLATIGSHTHAHTLLDRADAATAAGELDRSIELLGERLGVHCRHFAYPKALLGSPDAEAEVRARFATATVAGGTANVPGRSDLHRLTRTPIQVTDGMRWFRRKADGGLRGEDRARRLLDRGRYAGATT